jgi:hypothetical protein
MPQELVIHDAKFTARLDRLGRAAKQAHDRVRKCAIKAVENMVRSGQALCKARDLCDTVEWDQFVAKYFGRAERTAQTYMKLARNWPVLQAVAPPEALTSQRKALRLLNSLVLGEAPGTAAAGPRRKQRRGGASLEPPAPAAAADEERRVALSRIYQQMLRVLANVTKDLSEVTPSNYDVRNALDAIRRARNDFVASAEKLFPHDVPPTEGSDTTAVGDAEGQKSQNPQEAIAAESDDNS